MSEPPDRDSIYREHARRMVADRLSDADIGHTIVVTYDEEVRHLVWQHVFRCRDEAAARTLTPADGMTTLARETIPKIADEAARLRRSGGVSLTGLAATFGVDRGTLKEWIRRGWMRDPRG